VNPLASHWLRMTFWLFAASPIVAFAIMLTTEAGFGLAIALTLYMWAIVCVILAMIAFAGLILRLIGRGMRALRR
jgi:Na+/H+-dicarboxylate symporter